MNYNKFTPTKWDSVEQKTKFFKHFQRFLGSGCKRSLFYKWFYKRLSMTFGHIAHYDANGFYETYFTSEADFLRFLGLTMQHPCYGDPEYTYSDVESRIQDWLTANKKDWGLWLNRVGANNSAFQVI